MVVETMREEQLSYTETERQFALPHRRTASWERIYLEEGPEGLAVERRGRSRTGKPRKLPKEKQKKICWQKSSGCVQR